MFNSPGIWLSQSGSGPNRLIIVFEEKNNFPVSESVSVTGLALWINRLIWATQAVSASYMCVPRPQPTAAWLII